MKTSQKQKDRPSKWSYRKQLREAMADFTRPTLEEMLKEGKTLFNRRRPSKKSRRPSKLPVIVVRLDNLENERSSAQTLPELLWDIRRALPRRRADADSIFCVGGRRTYIAVTTLGRAKFSVQYPIWRGRRFQGGMLFSLQWADVEAVLRKFYDGCTLDACFAGYVGYFAAFEE